ncbi:YitT family protein [soil metagenome]
MSEESLEQIANTDADRIKRLNFSNLVKNFFLITTGIASATLGLKGFLLPNGFLDGGATGISLLLNLKTGIEVSIWIMVINLPLIFIGWRQVSKNFAIKTFFAIFAFAIVIHFFQMESLTQDKLLISVFGGFFLGAGIGLAIRGGCVIDGTEVLAVFVNRHSSLSVGDFIALFNIVLFAAAAFLVNLETALYSMLTYITASKMIDFVITGIDEYIGVTIISEKSEEIKQSIINNLGRAVTVYKGESGYGKRGLINEERKILFSVVTRLEVQKLVVEIEKIDEEAFVIQQPINDTKGGVIKKRGLH